MALGQADVEGKFPFLELDVQQSGFPDSESVAEDTIDPNDDASDLVAMAFLDGYEVSFVDLQALLGDESSAGVGAITSAIYLFDADDSASAYMGRQNADYASFEGKDVVEGVTLAVLIADVPPDIGSEAIAFRATVRFAVLNRDLTAALVLWQRGPLMAAVAVSSFGDENHSGAAAELALRMEGRIDEVLAGELAAKPIVAPSQSTTLSNVEAGERARAEGYNIQAILPHLEDLGEGALLAGEGFSASSGNSIFYRREFAPQGLTFLVGASSLMSFSGGVELHVDTAEPRRFISLMSTLDPALALAVIGQGFAQNVDLNSDDIKLERLDVPQIGDASAGLQLDIKAVVADLKSFMIFFTRERFSVQLMVLGPADQVEVGDIIALARLVAERIE